MTCNRRQQGRFEWSGRIWAARLRRGKVSTSEGHTCVWKHDQLRLKRTALPLNGFVTLNVDLTSPNWQICGEKLETKRGSKASQTIMCKRTQRDCLNADSDATGLW